MSRTIPNKLYSAYDVIFIRLDMLVSTLRTLLSLSFQGCVVGKGFRSTGHVRIKARESGSIRLGEGVTLLGHWRSNRVGLSGPVILQTFENGRIEIGDHTGASAVVISSRSGIRIGKHCNLGGNVRIFDHDFHALNAEVRRSPRGCSDCATRPVNIGDDVFVGAESIILKGVTIGDRAVIGAGSVVTRDVPPDCIAAGNPARVVRKAEMPTSDLRPPTSDLPLSTFLPMRIAILAEFPLSALTSGAMGRGGGQGCTWLPQLALAFQEYDDLEIHWVVLDRTIRRTVVTQSLGQWFHRVPALKFSVDLALNYLPARFVLKREIRRIKPDIVHAWGTELIYPAALRDFKGPTMLSMQGVLTAYRQIGGLPDNWIWNKMIASESAFIKSSTVVTSESQWGIDRVRAIDPDVDCRMVEYGVHPSFYELPWQPNAETPYALFVGGADKRKGVDLLIKALQEMPGRTWEMRFAGDPAIQQACDAAGLKNVSCLGMLPWSEMQKQLQGAWCSVLPTRGDTSPNSVKEARVIGVPMVTSIHGGQAGYIKDGINGRIVEPLTSENLSEALADVMSSHQRAQELGKGRHEEDRAYLHPKRTAEGFASIYRELAASEE